MASPLVIFAAGMGTAALSLGLGYATLYVPDGSQPSKTQIILANRPEPPPPTVEKVKREPRPVVRDRTACSSDRHVTRDPRDRAWLGKRTTKPRRRRKLLRHRPFLTSGRQPPQLHRHLAQPRRLLLRPHSP